jgi:solute:Na+ symporter, SSS family
LETLDWMIVGGYVSVSIAVGLLFAKRAGRSMTDYFLSGRSLPWWVVGTSMVATTFAADTPLAVTEYVRGDGIWGNWFWWTLAISHVLGAIVFSRLWRRAEVLTDNELIELRYHGKPAAVLRAFKACYFSTLYNFIVMGWVTAAMSTVLSAFLNIPITWAVLACMVIALFYSLLSGFWGVVVTDVIQFAVAMIGSVVFAVLAANEVGGMGTLVEKVSAMGNGSTLDFFPGSDAGAEVWGKFLVFVLIMWWSTHNADGGGYIIQRMMSAKNERHAQMGTLWFAVAHYVLRVWPWVVVALASMVLLPTLALDREAYPQVMASILPAGLRGLFVAVFLAAFMSTIDTHLNWGSSYIVNDLYKRFLKPKASAKHYVLVSKITSFLLMIVTGFVAMTIQSISAAWEFVWAMGAGVGAVLILRWFWWRINAWSELSAMATSLVLAVTLVLRDWWTGDKLPLYLRALIVVFGSMIVWVTVTFLTRPEPREVLERFVQRVRPGGRWPFVAQGGGEGLRILVAWAGGVAAIYGGMFLVGSLVLQKHDQLWWTSCLLVIGSVLVWLGLRERKSQ